MSGANSSATCCPRDGDWSTCGQMMGSAISAQLQHKHNEILQVTPTNTPAPDTSKSY